MRNLYLEIFARKNSVLKLQKKLAKQKLLIDIPYSNLRFGIKLQLVRIGSRLFDDFLQGHLRHHLQHRLQCQLNYYEITIRNKNIVIRNFYLDTISFIFDLTNASVLIDVLSSLWFCFVMA